MVLCQANRLTLLQCRCLIYVLRLYCCFVSVARLVFSPVADRNHPIINVKTTKGNMMIDLSEVILFRFITLLPTKLDYVSNFKIRFVAKRI
jgi:hypothetical protein